MLIKSAKSGNSDAMVMLGLLHHKGVGVKKNIDIAKEWWLSASKKKDLDARVIYAFYFETKIYEVERNQSFLEHLVIDENQMPRIFDPNKANIAPFVKEKKAKKVDETLEKEIKRIVNQNKGKNKKVTPGYKKKMKEQIDKAKRKRKREIIKADIKKRQRERAIQRTKGEF
jgi:TPR repeat protein